MSFNPQGLENLIRNIIKKTKQEQRKRFGELIMEFASLGANE